MSRRLSLGRLQLYAEPRDAWIGAYIAAEAIYICLLPFLVIRWRRRPPAVLNLGHRRLGPIASAACDTCPAHAGQPHRRGCDRIPTSWWQPQRARA